MTHTDSLSKKKEDAGLIKACFCGGHSLQKPASLQELRCQPSQMLGGTSSLGLGTSCQSAPLRLDPSWRIAPRCSQPGGSGANLHFENGPRKQCREHDDIHRHKHEG